MKKFIIILSLIFVSISTFAQNQQWFQADSFAYKPTYGEWSKWEPSNVKICFDFYNNRITIYSPQIQIYQVITQVQSPYDSDGYTEKYLVRGQNGYNYYIRLRIANDGTSQLYVDANDVIIVYNVRRIQ